VFCRIADRAEKAMIVFEDAISLAFLDDRPLFPGHCLLITKAHYETISDLPRDLVGPLFLNVQMLSESVTLAVQAEGTFIAANNIVSQSVPHFHVHIVPRRRKDGLRGFFWPRQRYGNEEEIKAVQEAIRTQMDEP
jgi:histidine triad (HIT) family protein